MTMPSLLSLSLTIRKTDFLLWGALLLLAFAAVTQFWLTPQARDDADEYRLELSRLQLQPSESTDGTARIPGALDEFEAVLESRSQIPLILERNFSLAREFHIELGRGEYRLDQDLDGGFYLYRMALPVKGPYLALRPYIDAVLAEWPGIALEQVSFSRGHPSERETEAVLRFAMLVTDQP